MDHPAEPTPLDDSEIEPLAESIASQLSETVAGYDVRVDAGEKGRVWVALRGALGDEEAERAAFERLEGWLVDRELGEQGVEVRLSSGASGEDLVLMCEFYDSLDSSSSSSAS